MIRAVWSVSRKSNVDCVPSSRPGAGVTLTPWAASKPAWNMTAPAPSTGSTTISPARTGPSVCPSVSWMVTLTAAVTVPVLSISSTATGSTITSASKTIRRTASNWAVFDSLPKSKIPPSLSAWVWKAATAAWTCTIGSSWANRLPLAAVAPASPVTCDHVYWRFVASASVSPPRLNDSESARATLATPSCRERMARLSLPVTAEPPRSVTSAVS